MSSYFTVSEVNGYISKLLLSDFILSDVSVKGEAQNVNYHSNGNIYLTLRDEKSVLKVVIPSGTTERLQTEIYKGKEIGISGRLQINSSRGEYSLITNHIEDIGLGELHRKFIELKGKLEEEGLFDQEKKKALPEYIKNIGIVTSTAGAVIHDIINGLKGSNLKYKITVFPSLVQGQGAAKNLEEGIQYFNSTLEVDIIILARGGGSFEDLSAFNEESLARSCFTSKVPVISAVGHQTDFVITDFSSDIRAQTPTQAAEIITNNNLNFLNNYNKKYAMINEIFKRKIINKYNYLRDKRQLLEKENPLFKIKKKTENLKNQKLELDRCIESLFNKKINKLNNSYNELLKLNPSIKASNRAMVKNQRGQYINSIKAIEINEKLLIEFLDGYVVTSIKEIRQGGIK